MVRASIVGLFLVGCSAVPVESSPATSSEPTGINRQAVGEQENGFPSPWERAVFMAANRARSDPSTVKGSASTVYPATSPLVLEYDLERSSRFHATSLDLSDVTLMHTSPCTLNTDVATSGCTGDPTCACATPVPAMCANCAAVADINTCGTAIFTRIAYFYPAGNAEVAAAGFADPWSLMDGPDGWVTEAAGADGHRTIIDDVDGHEGVAGFGHAGGTSGTCFSTFDVGDFGPATTAPPTIASAAPMPISGPAGTFRVYATWNDPVGGAPLDLNAVVDGTCSAMTLELGDPKLNATYYADVSLTAGCHSVFIVGDDASMTRSIYPTTTAFTIAVGSGTCADEMAQPAASCSGLDGGVGGGEAGIDSGGIRDGSDRDTAAGDDGGRPDTASGSPEAGDGTGAAGVDGGPDVAASANSGCACSEAPSTGTTGDSWAALASASLVVFLRRRR